MSSLIEVAKAVALLLCILSLYAVFHVAFLIPGMTVNDRIWDSLELLVPTAGISVVSGLLFREGEHSGAREGSSRRVGLSVTLPMLTFFWGTGIMVGLFVLSWYAETYVISY